MKGDVSLGRKFVNLISSSIWISIKNFSEARGFLLVLRSDSDGRNLKKAFTKQHSFLMRLVSSVHADSSG